MAQGWIKTRAIYAGILCALCVAAGCGNQSCDEGGKKHSSGSSWTCDDGCNTCSCEDGTLSQTTRACPPMNDAGSE